MGTSKIVSFWTIRFAAILFLAGAIVTTSCGDDDDTSSDNGADGDSDDDDSADDNNADDNNAADNNAADNNAADIDTADGQEGKDCEISTTFGTFSGTCGSDAAECEGGTAASMGSGPIDSQGNCADGLVCCVGTDRCEVLGSAYGATCHEEPCPDDLIGNQMGCPDFGWCCFKIEIDLPDGIEINFTDAGIEIDLPDGGIEIDLPDAGI